MAAKKTMEQEFLSTGTIAKLLDTTAQTIRNEIKAGKLKAEQWGRDYVIRVEWYEEYKARNIKPIE